MLTFVRPASRVAYIPGGRVGDGLVAIRTLQAVVGAADIADRYAEHCEAARRIAEEHFDALRVLSRFCEQAGIG